MNNTSNDSSTAQRLRIVKAEPVPQLLTTRQLCNVLQICQRTAQTMRDEGRIPFLRLSKTQCRYSLEQVQRALEKQSA